MRRGDHLEAMPLLGAGPLRLMRALSRDDCTAIGTVRDANGNVAEVGEVEVAPIGKGPAERVVAEQAHGADDGEDLDRGDEDRPAVC